MRVARPHLGLSTVENRVTSDPRKHSCKHRCGRKPKVSKPSHHRFSPLSQAVRRHGHGPITVSRQSKIGPITIPANMRASIGDRKPKVSKPPAPSHHRLPTLLQHRNRFSLLRICRVDHLQCSEKQICSAKSRGSGLPPLTTGSGTASGFPHFISERTRMCTFTRTHPHARTHGRAHAHK